MQPWRGLPRNPAAICAVPNGGVRQRRTQMGAQIDRDELADAILPAGRAMPLASCLAARYRFIVYINELRHSECPGPRQLNFSAMDAARQCAFRENSVSKETRFESGR